MEIRFEECVAIFRVCCYTRSTCVATFYNNIFLSSVHLKFDIRSMRFEPVIFVDECLQKSQAQSSSTYMPKDKSRNMFK